MSEEYQQLLSELQKLKSKLPTLQRENADLQNQIIAKTEQYKKDEQTGLQVAHDIQQQECELARLQKELNTIKSQNEILQKHKDAIGREERESTRRQGKGESWSVKISNLEGEKSLLMEDIANVKSDTETLNEKRISLRRQVGMYMSQLEGLNQQLAELERRKEEIHNSNKRSHEESKLMAEAMGNGMMKFYDVIISIDTFMNVVNRGWKVLMAPGTRLDQWSGPIVTVMGDFKKGKTFILSKLTGSSLPTSVHLPTEGLSFKRAVHRKRNLVLLDTAGSNAPVEAITEDLLQQKKAEELFLRQVSFEAADVFLYVVGSVNAKEQIDLYGLCRDLSNSNKMCRKVIIVHNLMDVRTNECMAMAMERIKHLYRSCVVVDEEVVLDRGTRSIQYLEGVDSADQKLAELQRHFVMGRDGTPAGQLNDWVISKLRQLLLAVPETQRDFNVQQKLLSSCNKVIKCFINPTPTLHFVDQPCGGTYLMAVESSLKTPLTNTSIKQVTQRSGSISSYQLAEQEVGCFLSSERLACPPSLTNSAPNYEIQENSDGLLIIFQLPGVNEDPDVSLESTKSGLRLIASAVKTNPISDDCIVKYHQRRRVLGPINHQIELPNCYTDCPLEAEFDCGILKVKIQKPVSSRRVVTVKRKD